MATDLKSTIDKLAKRSQKYPSIDEPKTKDWFIAPLLKDLGCDVSDPSKVIPEYDADPRDKKTGKVDYAIIDSNRKPIIYIEAKKLHDPLDQHNHYNQIKRYKNNELSVKFVILTNGYEYRFYTDLCNENHLDSEPFLSFTLENYTDSDLENLSKFSYENFDVVKVRELAKELSYQSKILEYLKGEISDPDRSDLARFVTKKALKLTRRSDYSIVKKILPLVLKELLAFKSKESDVQRTSNEVSDPVVPDKNEVQKTENEIQGGAKNIFDVTDPTFHKLEYFEFLKDRVNQTNFTDLYIYVIKKLFERDKELLLNVIGEKWLGIVKRRPLDKPYEELSSSHFLITSTYASAKTRFKHLKKILIKFDLKDSLFVRLVKIK